MCSFVPLYDIIDIYIEKEGKYNVSKEIEKQQNWTNLLSNC